MSKSSITMMVVLLVCAVIVIATPIVATSGNTTAAMVLCAVALVNAVVGITIAVRSTLDYRRKYGR